MQPSSLSTSSMFSSSQTKTLSLFNTAPHSPSLSILLIITNPCEVVPYLSLFYFILRTVELFAPSLVYCGDSSQMTLVPLCSILTANQASGLTTFVLCNHGF